MVKYSLSVLLVVFCSLYAKAQSVSLTDLKQYADKVTTAPLYKFSGSLNSNLIYTSGTNLGINTPVIWALNGNLDVTILDKIKVPVSLNLSSAGIGYKLPQSPSRIALRPVYKWVKGYLGTNNMSFSPYTLNGHVFSGVGIEMEPPASHLKISAMYGRLQKAVEYDSTNTYFKSATYERYGYGTKLIYEQKKYDIGLILFGGKDTYKSLLFKPDFLGIRPQQNFVVSYLVTLRPTKGILFNGEFATSYFTADTRTGSIPQGNMDKLANYFYNYKESTRKNNAFKIQVGYNIKKTILGVMIERITPGYQSMGSYFINNDLENLAFNFSHVFLNNKLTIAGNMGTQQDNLNNNKSSTSNRFLGSLNINYLPKENIYTSFNYTSFKSFMYVQPVFQSIAVLNQSQFQNLDTLNFKQVSDNANYYLNYKFKTSAATTRAISFNINYLNTYNLQTNNAISTLNVATKYYNSSLAYQYNINNIGLNFNAVYNYNLSVQSGNNSRTHGPTVSASSSVLNKKLKLGLSLTYNNTLLAQNNSQINTLINRFNADYKIKKSAIRFDFLMQNRSAKNVNSTNSMGNLSYSLSF